MILPLFFIAPERRAAKQFKQSENILSIYYLQYPDHYVQNIIYLKRQPFFNILVSFTRIIQASTMLAIFLLLVLGWAGGFRGDS